MVAKKKKKYLVKLWIVEPPNNTLTPRPCLLTWWTATDSSYVTPPTKYIIISCGLKTKMLQELNQLLWIKL